MKGNKLIIFSLLAGTLALLSACSDFLDVKPSDKQTADQLFAAKSGYYAAANGIYDALASETLYGRQMSWEAIELIGKRYVSPKGNSVYQDLSNGNFTTQYASSVLTSIWKKSYELILAANLLIDRIDNQSQGMLSKHEADLMKGEMLAVRAFLHLDMLRLFGPCIPQDPKGLAIPYNESADIAVYSLLPADEVIAKIIRDLDAAETLMQEDPVIAEGPLASEGENEESVQLRYRQYRFNYYTVIALKARAYLWGEDKPNALIQAKRLIEDPAVARHFPAVDPNRLLANATNPDRVFSSEVLTGVYVKTRDLLSSSYLSSSANTHQFLQPHATFITSVLFRHLFLNSNETGDYRFQTQWEAAGGTGSSGHVLTKYNAIDKPDPTDEDSEYFYAKMIPLVKLQEMYYIAAECEPEATDRLKWYDEARVRRGCQPLVKTYLSMIMGPGMPQPSPEEMEMLTQQLMPQIETYFPMFLNQEYLREFYGEGQSYYRFKRTDAWGYGYGFVSPYDSGESQQSMVILPIPPIPEGEMK